ncbi:MAG: plastocyanin [Kovacikia sp.]
MSRFALAAALLVGAATVLPAGQVFAKEWTVDMGDKTGKLVFVPKTLTIAKGDTVKWVFVKAGPHNVVFDDAATKAYNHEKLIVKTDPTFVTKFDKAGVYKYHCTPHKAAGMVGEITVK